MPCQWSRNSRGEWPPTSVTLIAQWTGGFHWRACPLLSRITFTKVVRHATRQTNIIKLLLIWQSYSMTRRVVIIELIEKQKNFEIKHNCHLIICSNWSRITVALRMWYLNLIFNTKLIHRKIFRFLRDVNPAFNFFVQILQILKKKILKIEKA